MRQKGGAMIDQAHTDGTPPRCAAGSTESKVNTTTATPTPEALAIAVIFKDFEIDHTPDGWPAVKQMHLSAAAAELERQHAEIDALRALLSKKPIIGSGRTQYDRLIKAARNIEQSVNSSSSWWRIGPDDSDIAWKEFKSLASDVCTLIDSPPDNEALKAERARSGLAHRKAVQEAVREALQEAEEACGALRAPESCSGVERSLWDVATMACAEAVGKVGAT